MDSSLIIHLQKITKENAELTEKLTIVEREREVYAQEKVNKLRADMYKSLANSDIEREKMAAKLEVFEKMTQKQFEVK